jgi:hypothetical protein
MNGKLFNEKALSFSCTVSALQQIFGLDSLLAYGNGRSLQTQKICAASLHN